MLYDYADFKYEVDCLKTDLITSTEYKEHPEKVIIQDGELVLNPDYPVVELEEAKQAKIKENDLKRDEALNQGILYKDVLFDSDTDQKVNLLAIVSTMGDEDVIIWYGKDNQPLECSKEDLINIGGLITQLHSFCWTNNAEIKGAINDAETIEEVENIVIDYTMSTPETESTEEPQSDELPNLREESEETENV